MPHESVAGTQIQVQAQVFQMFEHDAAMAVHDAFRRTGGARREQHPQRVGERDGRDLHRRVEFEHSRPWCDAVTWLFLLLACAVLFLLLACAVLFLLLAYAVLFLLLACTVLVAQPGHQHGSLERR